MSYKTWNRENVNDEVICQEFARLAKGELEVPAGTNIDSLIAPRKNKTGGNSGSSNNSSGRNKSGRHSNKKNSSKNNSKNKNSRGRASSNNSKNKNTRNNRKR